MKNFLTDSQNCIIIEEKVSFTNLIKCKRKGEKNMYGLYAFAPVGLKIFEPLEKIAAAAPQAVGSTGIIIGALIAVYGIWALFQQFKGQGQGWVKPIVALVFGIMLMYGGISTLQGLSKFGQDVIKDVTN